MLQKSAEGAAEESPTYEQRIPYLPQMNSPKVRPQDLKFFLGW